MRGIKMKIEKIERSAMVEEMLYLMVEVNEMEEAEAIKKLAMMNDNEIVEKMNMFYDGTGMKFDIVKIK